MQDCGIICIVFLDLGTPSHDTGEKYKQKSHPLEFRKQLFGIFLRNSILYQSLKSFLLPYSEAPSFSKDGK